MDEDAVNSSNCRGRSNWRSRGRGGRYNRVIRSASEERGNTPQPSNSNTVSPRCNSVRGRRGWQPRGRNGTYNHTSYPAHKHHDSVQMSFDSSTDATESASSCNAVPAVSHHSSSSLTAGHNSAGRPPRRSRGNRRPWRARSVGRPDFVPSSREADCSGFQHVEDCSSSSWLVASTADASESIDEDAPQSSNIFTLGTSTVISNNGKNAQLCEFIRSVHGNRGRPRARYPLHRQIHSRCTEKSKTQYKVTGSTPFDGRMPDELELELVSNVEVDDEAVDDDDDFIEARNVPVTGRGKHKNLSVRSRGVRGNRRGHSRAGRVRGIDEYKHKATADMESLAHFVALESSVRDAVTEQKSSPDCSKSDGHQKHLKQNAANTHQKYKIANTASVAADDENEVAMKFAASAADVKLANVDKHRKNSASKPSVHIDENSLFWHLVNEHSGKCCIDVLKHRLNTCDADDAIAILRTLKRIKILVNDSDKWKSVAFVFLKGLRICLHVKAGCKKKDCTFLHLCPNFVSESCQHGDLCHFGHNVRIPSNALCLQNSAIPDICSSESVLTIARCSNPIICAEYNEVGEPHCHSPVQCIRLHVCNHFFRGRCLFPDSECTLGHVLASHHNKRLLTLYEVKHLMNSDEKLQTLHRMILPVNSIAHSLTHTRATQQRGKPHISSFIDVMQPTVSSGVQVNEHEMKNSFVSSSVSAGHLLATDDTLTQLASSQQAKHSLTLPRFTVSQDLASKTSSLPADAQLAISAEDQSVVSTGSSESVHRKTNKQTASVQSAGSEIAAVEAYQLPSDRSETAQMIEAAITRQLEAMQRWRNQSNETLEFHDNQCQMYVRHLCNESNECSVRHDSLPYLWRVQDAGKWVPFEDNASIEKAFCSPDNRTYAALYKVCIYFYRPNSCIIFL